MSYVGGGFGVGIHNTLEAAVWGVPVFFGPNNQHFQEAQGLKACGGGIEIQSSADFARQMNRLLADESALARCAQSAGNYVRSYSGALEKVMREVEL